MSSSLTQDQIAKLKSGLELCILKSTSKERSSSLALTESGREYLGAVIGSDTNLMNISSEQSSLALSIASTDFPVEEIITMTEENNPYSISPIVVKIMIDYIARTNNPIKYTLININGKILFQTDDIQTIFPLYKPLPISISRVKESYSPNQALVEASSITLSTLLKEHANLGLARNFPLYDTASSYGTAVYTTSKKIYYAGQYSSPDKRLNMHSEMVAIVSSIMDKNNDITDIGIVSNKYPDSPCNMCGSCRQFIAEISAKLKITPNLYCFASETGEFSKTKIEEYLPNSWSSKKWT